jgi:4-hydroxybenzoate polyprenyltransferase
MRSFPLIVRSMRPSQWVKNSLIFAPLLFAQELGDPEAFLRVTLTFALFCLLSGGVYLINDILDRDKDRLHPFKRNRPIASGALPPSTAATAGATAIVVTIGTAFALGPKVVTVMAAYLLLNISYSLFLKHLVIIDVMTVATGFLLRVIVGALAIPVAISFWLLLCTGLLALFLGFGKRRHELVLLDAGATSHRPILREYSPYFLDQMISVVTTSTVVTYALYTMSPDVREKLGTDWLGLTIPFVLYGVFRYLYLIHQKSEGGDPSQTILTDRPLLANIFLWGGAVVAILYFR